MIGNDIVDLALTRKESNWKRKGFLDKIFTLNEKKMIFASENPELTVWNLWSRKEAAYKIYNRYSKVRAFNPIRLECFNRQMNENVFLGEVYYNNQSFFTSTIITVDYVYSIAVANKLDFNKIKSIDSQYIVKDSNGIPYNYLTNSPVSISHHGSFVMKIQLDFES